MDLRQQLLVLRRQWLVILACLVVAVGVAVAFNSRQTAVYESHTRLFVSSNYGDGSQAYQVGLFAQQRVVSYADLATTDVIARRVIDQLGLTMSPSQLSTDIRADPIPDTVIFTITVQDPDAKRAQALAQAVSESLISYVSELETAAGPGQVPLKVTIVDSANLPASPVSPRTGRNLALAVILGLLVGLVAANLRDGPKTVTETPSGGRPSTKRIR